MLKNTQPVLFKIYMEAGLKELAKTHYKEDGLLTRLLERHNFNRCHEFLLIARGSTVQTPN